MILILEGPDGSGKSTLAAKLSEQTGYPVVHRSAPKSEEEKAKMMQMYRQAIEESKDIIFDRCWYSEMVYGPIMRDESCLSYEEMYKLELELCKCGALLIYCTGPVRKLWNRCQKRGETYIKSFEEFSSIYDGYEKIMRLPHLIPVVRYAYEDM